MMQTLPFYRLHLGRQGLGNFFYVCLFWVWGFSGGTVGKEYTCSAGDAGDGGLIPGSGRSPEGGHGNPFQYSCLENSHGQRSLVGYSPWGRKELNTTEWLTHTHPESTVLKSSEKWKNIETFKYSKVGKDSNVLGFLLICLFLNEITKNTLILLIFKIPIKD